MQIGQGLHKRRSDALVRLMAGISPAPARGRMPAKGCPGPLSGTGFPRTIRLGCRDLAYSWLTLGLHPALAWQHWLAGPWLAGLWLAGLWVTGPLARRQRPGTWRGPRSWEDLGFGKILGLWEWVSGGWVCGLGPKNLGRTSRARTHVWRDPPSSSAGPTRTAFPAAVTVRRMPAPPLCAVRRQDRARRARIDGPTFCCNDQAGSVPPAAS